MARRAWLSLSASWLPIRALHRLSILRSEATAWSLCSCSSWSVSDLKLGLADARQSLSQREPRMLQPHERETDTPLVLNWTSLRMLEPWSAALVLRLRLLNLLLPSKLLSYLIMIKSYVLFLGQLIESHEILKDLQEILKKRAVFSIEKSWRLL